MVTPCKTCGAVIFVPPNIPIGKIERVSCPEGHTQFVIGMGSLLEPTRVKPERMFPWLPPFP
jgi:hypothetical protein